MEFSSRPYCSRRAGRKNLAVCNHASLGIFHGVLLSLFLQIRSCQVIFVGGATDSHPIPVDGFDVWDTISNGATSPRKEVLLNIDFPEKKRGLLLTYDTWYSGAAIRVGDMKLLMNVPNATWYQVPEEGGVPPDMDEIWVSNSPVSSDIFQSFGVNLNDILERFALSGWLFFLGAENCFWSRLLKTDC